MNSLLWYITLTTVLYFVNLMLHLFQLGKAEGENPEIKMKDKFFIKFTIWAYWLDVLVFMFMTITGFSILFSTDLLRAVTK